MKVHGYAFTLIECIIGLLIFLILMGLAIPSMHFLLIKIREESVIRPLYHAVHWTQSEALKRNRTVILCPSVDGSECSSNWSAGYLIFVSQKKSNTLETPRDLIQFKTWQPRMGKIRWSGFPIHQNFQMHSNGLSNITNGTFYYCPANNDPHYAKAIIINRHGRARLSEDQDHDGIDEDGEHQPLHCK